ncbi:MAG: SIR2 family protein [Magnetospirillum sp.]|nr:SIR2 family protein [Magnetospirillum sp.]
MSFAQDSVTAPADGGSQAALSAVRAGLRNGSLVPYLGPGVVALAEPQFPTGYGALAEFFAARVALPRRAVGNPWASAQFIESRKHRATLAAMMAEAFQPVVPPLPFHRWLAQAAPPLIVDTWYDGTIQAAFAGRDDWGTIQGITRAGIGEDRWYRAYDRHGRDVPLAAAAEWRTVIYQPHGSVRPAGNFLIADSDYVEVLTEIDIQSPIPEEVRRRRGGRGFVFLGCRFHDQMLRSYARQILKRSGGPHYAVVDPAALARNEGRFVAELGLFPIATPLDRALAELTTGG